MRGKGARNRSFPLPSICMASSKRRPGAKSRQSNATSLQKSGRLRCFSNDDDASVFETRIFLKMWGRTSPLELTLLNLAWHSALVVVANETASDISDKKDDPSRSAATF